MHSSIDLRNLFSASTELSPRKLAKTGSSMSTADTGPSTTSAATTGPSTAATESTTTRRFRRRDVFTSTGSTPLASDARQHFSRFASCQKRSYFASTFRRIVKQLGSHFRRNGCKWR